MIELNLSVCVVKRSFHQNSKIIVSVFACKGYNISSGSRKICCFDTLCTHIIISAVRIHHNIAVFPNPAFHMLMPLRIRNRRSVGICCCDVFKKRNCQCVLCKDRHITSCCILICIVHTGWIRKIGRIHTKCGSFLVHF